MGQSSLARALGFDKVTVLRVLRGLQARGLVERGAGAGNRRNMSRRAHARRRRRCCEQAQKPAEKAYERLMAPLDRDAAGPVARTCCNC